MTDEQAVATATDNFYEALNILFTGNSQPMKDAWSHDADVTYMGPDGLYLSGWEKIAQMWDSVSAIRLGGRVNPKQLQTVIGNDMALIMGRQKPFLYVHRRSFIKETVFGK